MKTKYNIADDQIDYLQANRDTCAKGNARGWMWIRYRSGEWHAATYGGVHRLRRYVDGAILDADDVLEWLVAKPVHIIPVDAATLGSADSTVWDDADEQDVFTDARRCFWCGESERTVALSVHQTVEQGECAFCEECRESWDRAGELA